MSHWRTGEPVYWFSAGVQNNPTNATVMADTGAISDRLQGSSVIGEPAQGNYLAHVIVSCDTGAVFLIQWRNVANNAMANPTYNTVQQVTEQRLYVGTAAATPGGVAEFMLPMRIENSGERVRVMMNASITGNACATILWQKMA